MLRLLRNKKAQSTAEYAIVIGLVIAAITAMQIYVRRGMQGKVKDATDMMATELDAARPGYGVTSQYEPNYLTQQMDTGRQYTGSEEMTAAGGVTRGVTQDVQTRTGNITYGWGSGGGEEEIP